MLDSKVWTHDMIMDLEGSKGVSQPHRQPPIKVPYFHLDEESLKSQRSVGNENHNSKASAASKEIDSKDYTSRPHRRPSSGSETVLNSVYLDEFILEKVVPAAVLFILHENPNHLFDLAVETATQTFTDGVTRATEKSGDAMEMMARKTTSKIANGVSLIEETIEGALTAASLEATNFHKQLTKILENRQEQTTEEASRGEGLISNGDTTTDPDGYSRLISGKGGTSLLLFEHNQIIDEHFKITEIDEDRKQRLQGLRQDMGRKESLMELFIDDVMASADDIIAGITSPIQSPTQSKDCDTTANQRDESNNSRDSSSLDQWQIQRSNDTSCL